MNIGAMLGGMRGTSATVGGLMHVVIGLLFTAAYAFFFNQRLPVSNPVAPGAGRGVRRAGVWAGPGDVCPPAGHGPDTPRRRGHAAGNDGQPDGPPVVRGRAGRLFQHPARTRNAPAGLAALAYPTGPAAYVSAEATGPVFAGQQAYPLASTP